MISPFIYKILLLYQVHPPKIPIKSSFWLVKSDTYSISYHDLLGSVQLKATKSERHLQIGCGIQGLCHLDSQGVGQEESDWVYPETWGMYPQGRAISLGKIEALNANGFLAPYTNQSRMTDETSGYGQDSG